MSLEDWQLIKRPNPGLFFCSKQMSSYTLGRKGEQKQWFDEKNVRRNLTVVSVTDCYVTGLRQKEEDGYWAIQFGMLTKSPKNVIKPFRGLTKKAGIENPLNFFKEIRINDSLLPEVISQDGKISLKVGDQLYTVGAKVSPLVVFPVGSIVQVTGTSKGKGFQGVMKRHGFAGGPASHGQSDRERSPGSIGSRTIPGRVFKGKKMAGRMGSNTVTVSGLKIIESTENSLSVQGLIPGRNKSIVVIQSQHRNG